MKLLTRWLKQILLLFFLTVILTTGPVVTAWASQAGQSIPTMSPDTETPTETTIPTFTKTPVRGSGSVSSSNTPTIAPTFILPSQTASLGNTTTSTLVNPLVTVTFTPLPPTVTISQSTLTETLTGTPVMLSATSNLTPEAQKTITATPSSGQLQDSFNNGSFLMGVGALIVILAVYLVARGRNSGNRLP
jgi:hypothetical protein